MECVVFFLGEGVTTCARWCENGEFRNDAMSEAVYYFVAEA